MATSTVQQYGNVLVEGSIAVTTAAQSLKDIIAAGLVAQTLTGALPPSTAIYGFDITNNDPSATMFTSYSGTPSATRSHRQAAPNGGAINVNGAIGILNRVRIAATANGNAYLVVYG